MPARKSKAKKRPKAKAVAARVSKVAKTTAVVADAVAGVADSLSGGAGRKTTTKRKKAKK